MSEVAVAAGFDRLLSDERLTRRAVGGDERAFAAIFRRYHQSLYRFCLTLLGNPEDAQDALQNTMMKVMRALPGEERKIELKPWLYRIAHNESIDLLRRRRETRELDVEQIAPGYGLAEDVATRERLRRLLVDLRELPERQREVLVMRELADLDFVEIGTALGTTDAVARQTLYEARQSLRQMEEGREMSCDVVTRALSDGDGRVTRRRDVRAHLRSCAECRRFREEIDSRERTLAALSPLPAVAAAGMLQGLLGGSQAAAGGGLAAVLGGGAAKTVGASAAAKGVATAAVVAAVGVTAADRSGVIHLGLPGEGGAKSSTAVPGADAAAAETSAGAGQGDRSAAAKGGEGKGSRPEQAANVRSDDFSRGVGTAQGGEEPAAAANPGLEAHPGGPPRSPQADAKAQGPPPLDQVAGKEHGEHPATAAPGQETAAEHVPPVSAPAPGKGGEAKPGSGKGGGNEGAPAMGTPKSAPASPPSGPPAKPAPAKQPPAKPAPAKQPPASPPAAKPESPQPQPHPTGPPPKAEAAPAPAPANPGKGSEKSAEAGKKG